MFQYPLPTAQGMVTYANQEYSDGGVYREYVEARELKYATFRERIHRIRARAHGQRLLDVGCSCGYLIDVALQDGFDAYGVEFSEVAIAAASSQARPRIMRGDVNDLELTSGESFDVVTAFDILEHTRDPIQFLGSLKQRLGPGGLLVLTTPDTGHLLRVLMGRRWPMLQPFQHTILFSRRSLNLALKVAGFASIEITNAKKVLTMEYLVRQVQGLNPLVARLYGLISRVIPQGIRQLPLTLDIGEIAAMALRAD